MTKEKYMALADVQDIWTNQQKPWINNQLSDLEEKLEGPYYDEEHRCIVYPDYEEAYYNPQTGGIYL